MGAILIIDDSNLVREKLISILRTGRDFDRFLEARDGISGLKTLTDHKDGVDVVACDLNMPGMNGYEFLKVIRAQPHFEGIPVVMVTSQSEDEEMVRAFEMGANDFIVKPFNEAILKARMKNMLQMKRLQDQLREQKEIMEMMASTDPLTSIPNLRCFREKLREEFERARRHGYPLSLFIGDLDHFKRVNDTMGHPQGDAVLREAAQLITRILRCSDFVARYGGEEFVVLMPHTDSEGAGRLAERCRLAFEQNRFLGLEGSGAVTISIGVSTFRTGMKVDCHGLVAIADRALYAAKNGGRNRVEISGEDVE